MSVRLTVVGHGDATDPAAPNTSLLLHGGGWPTLLLDCGYSVPHALWRCGVTPTQLDGIWLSHTHADHAFGVPALLLWMRLAGRTRALTLLGEAGVLQRTRAILDMGYPGSFAPHKCYPLEFMEIEPGSASPDGSFAFAGTRLRCEKTDHKVESFALRLDRDGLGVAYSGDGAPTPESLELYEGLDWLVHECATLASEIRGHANLEALLPALDDRKVRNLILVHQAPGERAAIAGKLRSTASDGDNCRVHLPKPGDELRLQRRT